MKSLSLFTQRHYFCGKQKGILNLHTALFLNRNLYSDMCELLRDHFLKYKAKYYSHKKPKYTVWESVKWLSVLL